jgi:DNA-binding response OmpR family regulator
MPSKARVLVIDDDDDFRAILRHFLTGAGYAVTEAPGGEEGLRRFGEDKPDLVLLDFSMPDINGLEVCRRLRASENGRSVPVLMLTVRSQISTVAEGLEAGVSDYVLKPFEPKDLLTRIQKALAA